MAAVLDSVIIDPLEGLFDSVGAMQGDLAPLKRAAIGGAVGYGVVTLFKPGVAFNDDGSERPFYFGNSNDPKATYFPSWMFIAVPAIVCGVLI